MAQSQSLQEVLSRKTDDELYGYFADASKYADVTLAAVRAEIRSRGLPEDRLDELTAAARAAASPKQDSSNDSTFTFNGFGTKLYGKCDFRADESYITTMWITAMYCPIIPLRSLRIKPDSGSKYFVLERFSTYWPQAGRTYGFLALLMGSFMLAGWLGTKTSHEELLFVGLAAPFAWLFWSRSNEKKKCLARD